MSYCEEETRKTDKIISLMQEEAEFFWGYLLCYIKEQSDWVHGFQAAEKQFLSQVLCDQW